MKQISSEPIDCSRESLVVAMLSSASTISSFDTIPRLGLSVMCIGGKTFFFLNLWEAVLSLGFMGMQYYL